MNNIKISAVLPCYNVEKYIRKGLDSVLAQTLQEWEAILVDDGATDSTGRICDEYAAKDSRFRVIHQKNGGVSRARNAGMAEAKGELLYFMDPDDWIEPNCFEKCYETYKKYGCDIVHFSHWVWVGGNKGCETLEHKVFQGSEIRWEYSGPMSGLSQEALNHYYQGEFIWGYKKNWTIWAFAYDRKFIQDNSIIFLPGIRMFDDLLFAIETTIKAEKIVRIPDAMYNYEMREDGMVRKPKSNQRLFEDKYNLIGCRQRLREMVTEFDLNDYYLGSHVLSSLQLALQLSKKFKDIKLFKKYVTNPYIQESIRKVSLKNAPMKFAIPVRLLKLHCHTLLFSACWLLNKTGLGDKVAM